ncbi:MAG: glycosyltransferase [Deltaproteobacteria bacterium]|nr:glycosyltransferase [Deltaproteobacteria bacterium]
MKDPTLSICMIVRDEEKNLPRALSSVQGLADEIIVVDTGSKDKTVEIAKSFGAQVYFFEWCDNFSAARNESIKHATKDYILWLDADDEFDTKRSGDLKTILKTHLGYAFYLLIRLKKREVIEETYQIRVFPNKRGVLFEGRVHEQPFFSLKRKKIPLRYVDIPITHYGYELETNIREKLERNKRLLELDLAERPDDLITKFFYGKTLLGLGRTKEGLKHLTDFIQAAKKERILVEGRYVAIAFLDIFRTFTEQRKFEETLDYISEYRALYGKDFESNMFLADVYLFQEKYADALQELSFAESVNLKISTYPVSLPALRAGLYARKAFCLAKLGREKEAKLYIELARGEKVTDSQVVNLLADTSIVLKDAELLSVIIEEGGKYTERYEYLQGFLYLLSQDYHRAREKLEEAINRGYRTKNSYLALAIALKADGDPAGAVNLLEASLNMLGEDYDILKELVFSCVEANEIEKAKFYYGLLKGWDSDPDMIALGAYLSVMDKDWTSMLQYLFGLSKKLFPHDSPSPERILDVEKALIQKKELRAAGLVQKSIKKFIETYPT